MYSIINEIQEGVTIIVWLPTLLVETTLFSGSSATIVNNELSFGHAALRTYKGGENGNGDYLSFYPGRLDCGCGYENRDQAHFHRIQADEEDCYKNLVEMGALKRFAVHLDIVNVEAINQRIQEIKRAKGRIWGFQQNCSDLVLEALRAGVPDFSSLIFQRPYGWKTVFSLSSLIGFIIPELIDSYWMIMNFKRAKAFYFEHPTFDKEITCPSLSEWIIGLFKITPGSRQFIPAINLVKGIIGSVFSYHLIYLFSLFTNSKSQGISCIIGINFSKEDALKAFLFIAFETMFSELLRSIEKEYGVIIPEIFFLRELFEKLAIRLRASTNKIFLKNTNNFLDAVFYLSLPSVWSLTFLVQKYYYDITVTPNYVLKLANDLKDEQQNKLQKTQEQLKNIELNVHGVYSFFNRKTLLVTGGILACGALLFYYSNKLRFNINIQKPALT